MGNIIIRGIMHIGKMKIILPHLSNYVGNILNLHTEGFWDREWYRITVKRIKSHSLGIAIN